MLVMFEEEAKEGEEEKKKLERLMGTVDGLGAVSTDHNHTCVGVFPQGQDGPSAAFGVEV